MDLLTFNNLSGSQSHCVHLACFCVSRDPCWVFLEEKAIDRPGVIKLTPILGNRTSSSKCMVICES